jgi:TRAP-type mannitol/chloroaromatic compound transport system permease large subunit
MKIRKELWFGFTLMAILIAGALYVLLSAETITRGHIGLLMLSLVVVAIMLGFPTAFTLMGMGILFTWLSYDRDITRTLDLFVQSTYKVMTNDVLISVPLFVFMGYLVERANLIEKLFKSLHLSMARVPGSLAVATLVTCAVFATATGIVGAVVTLMGLLAFPAMLKAGYNTRMGAGAITAGGCLGIMIPPSVLLIVYGATAGVSVVQLYAGAFFPGLMLAALYVIYVIVVAKVWPHLAPPLPLEARRVDLPPPLAAVSPDGERRALPALIGALKGRRNRDVKTSDLAKQLVVALVPLGFFAFVMIEAYVSVTEPEAAPFTALQTIDASRAPAASAGGLEEPSTGGLQEPPMAGGLEEPPVADGVQEPPAEGGVQEPPAAGKVDEPSRTVAEPPAAKAPAKAAAKKAAAADDTAEGPAVPRGFWITLGIGTLFLAGFYAIFSIKRLQIFKMLLSSFFPLVILILAVLGSIVFGLTTPTEAAAVGAFGGFVLAAAYMLLNYPGPRIRRVLLVWVPLWAPFVISVVWFRLAVADAAPPVPTWFGLIAIIGIGIWSLMVLKQVGMADTLKESSYLTAKTSAMVCWLFVGSSIFSAAFALLGGQELVERWVLSMNLSKVEFLVLSQVIIFILGWPLEWTEIIVIFMPIFVPLLDNFGVDPLLFGLLVALNLQTAFLSPPVAMAAFYLKGVSPPHVTLNQIFAGMMPFMGIQVVAIFLLYVFPQIGLWLPSVVYGR